MKESDMFKPLKVHLNTMGFNQVYGEVGTADMVGINDQGEEIIIEMKKTLNFKVLEQIFSRFGRAKYLYVAVPLQDASKTFNPNHRFAYHILREYGIGLIYVPVELMVENYGRTSLKPYIYIDSSEHHVIKSISKEIKAFHHLTVGGSKTGDTITDYGYTMNAVKAYMKEKADWVSVDDILATVETHWTRPKPSLSADLRMPYNKEWCEFKRFGRGNVYRYIEGGILNESTREKTNSVVAISEKVNSNSNGKTQLSSLFGITNETLQKETETPSGR